MRLPLAVAAAVAFLCATLAALAVVLSAGLEEPLRGALAQVLERQAGGLLAVVFLACGFLVAILRALHGYVVLAVARTADEAAAMAADPNRRLAERGSQELRALAAAVNRLAARHAAHEREVEARIGAANAHADEERNRFATLVAELAQGVVVCNADGRILLYNRRARELFADSTALAGATSLGLGRSIYAFIDRDLVAYALEKAAATPGVSSRFVASVAADRLLRIEIAPVPHAAAEGPDSTGAAGDRPAYLLVCEDISTLFESEARRDVLLHGLTQGLRGHLANLRAAAETLHDDPAMPEADRGRFVAVIREESQTLAGRVEAAAREFASTVKSRWPLEAMHGADLVDTACRRIEARVGVAAAPGAVDAARWLRVDGFSLLQAITYLATRLRDDRNVRGLRLDLGGEGEAAWLDLAWRGTAMNSEAALEWETAPMNTAEETSPLSVRDVVERCGGEIWFQRDRAAGVSWFRFLLPAAEAGPPPPAPIPATATGRPEFYDFDLFRWRDPQGELDDMPLARLTYTVFDTETTGLDPAGGDEIIQIGAVRIVNRRLLRQEHFDQLIDPGRPLAAGSVRVHGITPAMLAGAPPLERVLPVFRAFVADTVLVAHNAAFDLRFLELKEAATGVRFDRPVLDTFLLSGVLFPHEDAHGLDTLAGRLGVRIVGRHTALGDAVATGEIFLRMLDLLAGRGIQTLREAREASERTYHARIRY